MDENPKDNRENTTQQDQDNKDENQYEVQYRRGKDVVVEVLKVVPRESAKDIEEWDKMIENSICNPIMNPSIVSLFISGKTHIYEGITVYREPGITDKTFQQAVDSKRAEYINELKQLLEDPRIRKRWEQAVIGRLEHLHNIYSREHPVPKDTREEYSVTEYDISTTPTGGTDILQVISNTTKNNPKSDAVLEKMKETWIKLRSTHHYPGGYVIRVVLREVGSKPYRTKVIPVNRYEPFTVISLKQGDTELDNTATYEGAHLAFVAQSGVSFSSEFTEGMVAYLAYSFVNNIEDHKEINIREAWNDLLRLKPFKAPMHLISMPNDVALVELSYVYGFAFGNALISTLKFEAMAEQARKYGLSEYALFLKINDNLSYQKLYDSSLIGEDGSLPNEREMLSAVLQREGVNPRKVLETATHRVEQIMGKV